MVKEPAFKIRIHTNIFVYWSKPAIQNIFIKKNTSNIRYNYDHQTLQTRTILHTL
ncbi:MAG: hypothetical protein AB8B69_09260 [Chitinophagales bacterium]